MEVYSIKPEYQSDALFSSNVREYRDWYFDFYGIDEMHSAGHTGKGVKYAVIDTGVPNHEDIIVHEGMDMRHDQMTQDNRFDVDGHGTHVAGIIAAQHNGRGTRGVAPDGLLHAYKGLGDEGQGSLNDIIASGWRAARAGCVLANFSLGFNGNVPKVFSDAIYAWYDMGMLCIGAAGNDGKGNHIDAPSKHPLFISVGSHDRFGNKSSFSDTGEMLDVYGAGDKVLSTYGTDRYQILSGTSMASPFICGLLVANAERLIGEYGRLTVEMVGDLVSHKIK